MHGGAHAALSCVVVNGLPDGDECREHACAVVALAYCLIGVEGALQFVALRVVQRFGGDEVVHVQVAVVSVLGHLRAVDGIAVLRVQLSGDDLGEPEEVSFAPVAVAAFVGDKNDLAFTMRYESLTHYSLYRRRNFRCFLLNHFFDTWIVKGNKTSISNVSLVSTSLPGLNGRFFTSNKKAE